MEDNAKDRAARSWFGYGRWDAPYWFIGMEPGGTDDHATYEAWEQLGGEELIDCRAHHLASNNSTWHDDRVGKIQPTWGRLIALMLGYEGKPADRDSILGSQTRAWGSINGDTAAIVISSLHSPNTRSDIDRFRYLNDRIKTLRRRLIDHSPRLVVFYGTSYQKYHSLILDYKINKKSYIRFGTTIFVLFDHPTSRPSKSFLEWRSKGQDISYAIETENLSRNPTQTTSFPVKISATYKPNDVIRLLVKTNPKIGKSRMRYDLYEDGMTIGDYIYIIRSRLGNAEAAKCIPDLKWDSDAKRCHIRIERQ